MSCGNSRLLCSWHVRHRGHNRGPECYQGQRKHVPSSCPKRSKKTRVPGILITMSGGQFTISPKKVLQRLLNTEHFLQEQCDQAIRDVGDKSHQKVSQPMMIAQKQIDGLTGYHPHNPQIYGGLRRHFSSCSHPLLFEEKRSAAVMATSTSAKERSPPAEPSGGNVGRPR